MKAVALKARRNILSKALAKAWQPDTPDAQSEGLPSAQAAGHEQTETQWVSLNGLPTRGLTPLLPLTLSDKALWASIQSKVARAKDDVPPLFEKLRSLQLGSSENPETPKP